MSQETAGIQTGRHGRFLWLCSQKDYMHSCLPLLSPVLYGRYLAAITVDGGAMRLTSEERQRGWTVSDGVGYSPKLESLEGLPYQRDGWDAPGYDEWYVFESEKRLGQRSEGNLFVALGKAGLIVPFVGIAGFDLSKTDPGIQEVIQPFWKQIDNVDPESYLADGHSCFSFVSRNPEAFDAVYSAMQK